jgi:hypothetical protein
MRVWCLDRLIEAFEKGVLLEYPVGVNPPTLLRETGAAHAPILL